MAYYVNGYIKSTDIQAFPVVNRDMSISKDLYSRHTSEYVITSIVNKLIDTDGFVISIKEDIGWYKPFLFNVHGYYFKSTVEKIVEAAIDEGAIAPEGDATTIFATIVINKAARWEEIKYSDESTQKEPEEGETYIPPESYSYKGVKFTLGEPNLDIKEGEEESFTIKILEYRKEKDDLNYAWCSDVEAAKEAAKWWYVPNDYYLKLEVGESNTSTIKRIDGGKFEQAIS